MDVKRLVPPAYPASTSVHLLAGGAASSRGRARSRPGMRRVIVVIALLLAAALPTGASAAGSATVRSGSVYAIVTGSSVVLGNALAERRWARDGLVTTALIDKRSRSVWSEGRRDFALDLAGRSDLGSERFTVTAVR